MNQSLELLKVMFVLCFFFCFSVGGLYDWGCLVDIESLLGWISFGEGLVGLG